MRARTTQPISKSTVPDRDQLAIDISQIFDQAQLSTANHRKNHVALHRIHLEFNEYKEYLNKGKLMKLTGERNFQETFSSMVMQVLPFKKGVASADRIVKFIGGYIKFINERAAEKVAEEKNSDDSDEDDDNTSASRFTVYLLKLLLKGFVAKEKNTRYRVLQTVAEMISHLGQIDEDIYNTLRAALVDRIQDREHNTRNQAVICLAKLCLSEDVTDLNGGRPMLDILLDTLAYDSSSDVRRTTLLNIPINRQTLPAILDRTRDTDANIRKVVYNVLAAKTAEEDEEGNINIIGPTHPRRLTIAQREFIVRNGLGDRDASVRAAASTLIATWVDVIDTKHEDIDVKLEERPLKKIESGVLSLLSLFDLGEGTIAEDALLSVFTTRVEIYNDIEFNDCYWGELSPEKAFLARVFVKHCKSIKDDTRLEATLPVVTAIAFRIQDVYNKLIADMTTEESLDNDIRDDERIARGLVISELLRLAVHLDYSDENGRRKTFQLVRDMLKAEALPEQLMAPCLDVLTTLASGERELIRLVVETVQELRDAVSGENEDLDAFHMESSTETSFEDATEKPASIRKSVEDMSAEQRAQVDQVDLRCLSLCIGMLERVNGTLDENSTLDVVIKRLIIPAVQRNEPIFRERGLKSLGLCCLISRPLALQMFGSFMSHSPASPATIRITLLQSLFDSFMVHENAMFKNQDNLVAVISFLLAHILEEQDPKVKAILCTGTSKLILSGVIGSIEAIKILLKTYLSPLTIGNQELRQCLTFFFQFYSYSSSENQKRMSDVFIHVFLDVSEDRRHLEEDLEIVSSAQVAGMFADWTNPLRLARAIKGGAPDGNEVDECVQLSMAENVIKILFEKDLKVEMEKEDKRVLCQLLNKLHIPDVVDDFRIRSLKLLVDNLRIASRRPLRDSVCNTAFTKFELTISKKFEKQLKGFTEAEFRKLEQLNELFEFLDSIIPLGEEELFDVPRKGKKRRSQSIASSITESPPGSLRQQKEKNLSRAKRARLSTSDNDGDEEQCTGGMAPQSTTRTLPKRAAAVRKPAQIIVISSDSEEERVDPTPGKKDESTVTKEETGLDQDIDQLLLSTTTSSSLSEIPHDSIFDMDSEEEEVEVNDLLVDN